MILFVLTSCNNYDPIKNLRGKWTVVEYLGHSDIWTGIENENDVLGQIMSVDSKIIFTDKIISNPVYDVKKITYDDILTIWRTDPDILGMKQGRDYNEIIISDQDDMSNQITVIEIDKNTLVLPSLSDKYFKMVKEE